MRSILTKLLLAITLASFTASSANAMFLQPDWWEVTEPGVGTNRYAYSMGDPVNKSDPSGHSAENPNGFDYFVNTIAAFAEYVAGGDNQDWTNTVDSANETAAAVGPFFPGWQSSVNGIASFQNGNYDDSALYFTSMVLEVATLKFGVRGASQKPGAASAMSGSTNTLGIAAPRIQLTSRQIASGHAFEKHIVQRGEFSGLGIHTRDQFAAHIEKVMRNASTSDTKYLTNNRVGYWHQPTGTVVIVNPRASDLGTAFQPTNGRLYFDGLR